MNGRRLGAGLLLALTVGGGGGWWTTRRLLAMERATHEREATASAAAEREVRTRDVAFYEARAAGDPESAIDRATLAALYLQRSRETADFADVLRAERSARASLALRTVHNEAAAVALASSLMSQHRFADARGVAAPLSAAAPWVAAHRALLGEACLELGDYACARAALDSIDGRARTSGIVAPTLARWAELRGDSATARVLLHRARAVALSQPGVPRERVAWWQLRVADLELRQGRARSAERALRAGLAASPEDHRLHAAVARLMAARHRWDDAIAHGERAVGIALDPATLGVMSDAYAARGDSARAAEHARTMEVAAGRQPGAYHRAWSLFLLDHGRQLPQVLDAARAELATRRDAYGHDVLAWALYRNGRVREARAAMAPALALGTQDALLLYHAGMIARADGDARAARSYLARALAVSAWWDHAGPDTARAVLDTLRREPEAAP
ncbi:hypothetical protein [Roseisolibacter agri]|uniref:Tetratricopeptide repeat protein n=1 Tax=Roseisolibacter agri TaxID=2014610 RepID=A0AA37Q584_9BACT|nr:hypothetical protein [Roseisolibacter agri]GLC26825.1 hypothetical protein rosag_33380 [Roseisolibacter agri]